MLSFEPELIAARDAGTIDATTAVRLTAIERCEVVPIRDELRAMAWIGVMLIVTGVGIVVKKHFQEIGPLTIAAVIGAAATGCYVWVALKKHAALDEYVVLLGALLISADVGFIEQQWHVLGSEWQRHFLLLAVVHAVAAYYFGSRAVLSLSVAALAAWLGIERRAEVLFNPQTDMATRAFLCAGIVGIWRLANRKPGFAPVFEHFAANLAFWGALILTFEDVTLWLGFFIALVLAIPAVVYGFRSRRETFVIYGYVYGLIAVDVAVVSLLKEPIVVAFYILVSTVAAIIALIVTHLRFRSERP